MNISIEVDVGMKWFDSRVLLLTLLLSLQVAASPTAFKSKTSENNFQVTSVKTDHGLDVSSECPQDVSAYTFTSQKQIDDFGQNYSGCTAVPYLHINGVDITNLDGLNNIEKVDRTLDKNHHYFDAIVIGTLSSWYNANPQLTEVSGFEHLTFVRGSIVISGNQSVKEINAFQNLGKIQTYFDPSDSYAGLEIMNNPKLKQIDALSKLHRDAYIYIKDNVQLNTINSHFDNLYDLDFFYIADNGFAHLTAFDKLTSVDSLSIEHSLLESLQGFKNIKNITEGVNLVNDKNLSQCGQLSAIYKSNKSIFNLDNTNPDCLNTLKK